jgi:MFS family permease
MIAAILTIKLMNKWGRKFFIQIGTLICAICLGALALAFFFKGNKSFDDSVP